MRCRPSCLRSLALLMRRSRLSSGRIRPLSGGLDVTRDWSEFRGAFDVERFQALAAAAPYVGEIGLDGASRVPMAMQRHTLASVLGVLQQSPRITSLHSYKATSEIVSLIEECPQSGLILHWWLGTECETARAVELGCYFSVNRSSARRRDLLARIPLDRVLPETIIRLGIRAEGLADRAKWGMLRRHLQKPTVLVRRKFAGEPGRLLRPSFKRLEPANCSPSGSDANWRRCRRVLRTGSGQSVCWPGIGGGKDLR